MKWSGLVAGLVLAALATLPQAAGQQTGASTAGAPSPAVARETLDRYCVTCHSDRLKTGGLTLQGIDLAQPAAHADTLEKVVKKLRLGSMPPLGRPRPEPAQLASLTNWFEAELDAAAAKSPNPGRTESLHRLNRAEYQNAIRDLLSLQGLNFATILPGDDASYGFDNIAGVLGMTPTHLERYMDAARAISRVAVGDLTLPPGGETYIIPPDLSQDSRFEEMPFGTRGGVRVQRYFPADGEYVIRFQAFTGIGMSEEEPNFIELSIDGERVFYEQMKQKPIKHTITGADIQANTDWEVRTPVKAGLRDVTVTFAQATSGQLEDYLRPYLRPPGISSFRLTRMGGYSGPYVGQVSFTGPLNPTSVGDTESQRRIFTCKPASAANEDACARTILSTLARRAYRRPVASSDIDPLMAFYRQGRESGDFRRGVQVGLERLLASPDFLFRIEEDPGGATGPYRLNDFELASRLSFFLWSSIPDDELLDVATRGQLKTPGMLERQTRRMLADPKAKAIVSNFAGQWLRLRNVQGTDPNAHMFPNFDDNLRRSMRRETEMLVESIIRHDRSVLELLSADYTFVDERLARHYGIPNVYGSHFRRVQVTDPHRRGILGQGSILTVTSQSNRTSPVTRGKWILENLLGAPPPAPPDNIPALEATKLEGTLRQRMEQHRKNPTCAVCHNVMDPLGFSLENFNALGEWRTVDDGFPVDAAGAMPDGTKFDGVDGLRTALLAKSDLFVRTMSEKLLIYALGRGIEPSDMPAIRGLTKGAAPDNYKFSSLVVGLVRSAPFQMRMPASRSGQVPMTQSAQR